MAFTAKAGVITLNTGTGPQAISGVGFQPVAVLFYATPHTTADAANNASAKMMVGAATSSSARWAHSVFDVDGTGSGDCQTRFTAGKCLLDIDSAGAVLWAADFTSMDTGGFTIDITTAPASAFLVYYLAVGGAEVSAKAGTFTLPTSGTSQAVSGVGFQPEAVIAAYGATGADTAVSHHRFGFGVAAADLTQSCYFISGRDLVGSSQKARAAQSATFLYAIEPTTDGVDAAATLGSMDADGFTVNISDNPGSALEVGYLALEGVSAKVLNDTQRTSAGTKATSGVGFQPSALIAFSVRSTSANQAAGGTSPHNSLGAASGSTAQAFTYNLQIDNAGTEDSASFNDDSYIVGFNSNTAGNVLTRGALSSFDTDGFTLDYANADATAAVIYFLALAAAETVFAGHGMAGTAGYGASESINVEAGFGTAGAVGSGTSQFTSGSGGTIYSKTGGAFANLQAFGVDVVTHVGTSSTKSGFGVVGTTQTSTNVLTVQPRGVSLGIGQGVLTGYPTWTRIDGGA